MLNRVLAHTGQPVAPHDVWTAWNADPVLIVGLVAAVWLYRRGSSGRGRSIDVRRDRAFYAAIVVLAIALLSPLDATASALASAHMVQHVLLVVVAAPLLAYSAPGSRLLGGTPLGARRVAGRARRLAGSGSWASAFASNPVAVWVAYVATLWFWHSAAAYDAAVRIEAVHAVEHLTFLGTAFLLWRVMIGGRTAHVPGGVALLLVFGAGMASVLLSVLLTFASEPWYTAYLTSTGAWDIDALSDQQLAGVLMWVPVGAIHVAIGLALFVSWIEETERRAQSAVP